MSNLKIEQKTKFPAEDFTLSVKFLFESWDTISLIKMYHHQENDYVDDLLEDLEKNLIEWVLDRN
jgi:hypothetical protein